MAARIRKRLDHFVRPIQQSEFRPRSLLASRFLERYDVQRIDSSRDIIRANNYNDIFSNRDEIRVRDNEMPSVSEVPSERPEAILHAFPDFLRIHWAVRGYLYLKVGSSPLDDRL
jgi:hypothetical protein